MKNSIIGSILGYVLMLFFSISISSANMTDTLEYRFYDSGSLNVDSYILENSNISIFFAFNKKDNTRRIGLSLRQKLTTYERKIIDSLSRISHFSELVTANISSVNVETLEIDLGYLNKIRPIQILNINSNSSLIMPCFLDRLDSLSTIQIWSNKNLLFPAEFKTPKSIREVSINCKKSETPVRIKGIANVVQNDSIENICIRADGIANMQELVSDLQKIKYIGCLELLFTITKKEKELFSNYRIIPNDILTINSKVTIIETANLSLIDSHSQISDITQSVTFSACYNLIDFPDLWLYKKNIYNINTVYGLEQDEVFIRKRSKYIDKYLNIFFKH